MKKINMKLRLAAVCIMMAFCGQSQTVVTVPVYPTDIDSCTVIYDAALGNAALKDFTGTVYAHTGVITNKSTGPGDWKYVIAGWTQNIPKAQMTFLGNNKYQIKMTPSIRSWYGVPAGETILKLAFVFRNSDGSKVGREANGGDIFADVYPAATSVNIILPSTKSLYLNLNDTIAVKATSPLAHTMKLFVNSVLVKTISGTTITDTLLADNFGSYWTKYWVRVLAENDTASRADSFFYSVLPSPTVADLPAGIVDGINYIDSTTAVLSLFSPGKKSGFVIGDFNDWEIGQDHYMNRTPDGNRFWLRLENLEPRREYLFQYLVDGNLRIADPYSEKVCDPDDQYISPSTYPGLLPYPAEKTNQIASYLQTAQTAYQWKHTDFSPPAVADLVVYELLIRDFTTAHDYPSLIDTLGYLKRLGINAIELMPVMEFEGNISWGYNPDFMFAPDKYYGTKNGLKTFIDSAHAMGIAVILDIVLNHQFGKSPLVRLYWDASANRPSADNPWFNQVPKHPYNVGFDFNHQSAATQEFSKRVLDHWAAEYKIDGFRFDLSKGFTQINSYPDNVSLWGQKDPARIAVLDQYQQAVRLVNPDIFFILEHFADNSEEKELSGLGMQLWGNSNYNYSQATMGWNTGSTSDFSWISYKNRGWSEPNLVGYMESHDEERQMYNNIAFGNRNNPPYNCRDTNTALLRSGMAAAFFITIPGPKMLWQFEELGYDYSINYPSGTSASRLDPKPIRWDYQQQWRRRYLFNTFATLIALKKDHPVFSTADFTLSVKAAQKSVVLRHEEMDVVVAGNFDVTSGSIAPGFTKAGTWYDYFSGDSIQVAGTADALFLEAGEYHLYTTKRLQKPIFTGTGETLPAAVGDVPVMSVYPNPTAGPVNMAIETPLASEVLLKVYDLMGNLVIALFEGKIVPGTTVISWDGRNEAGLRVPPGVYLIRLAVSRGSVTRKLVITQ